MFDDYLFIFRIIYDKRDFKNKNHTKQILSKDQRDFTEQIKF
jgi:hypothetical protein